MQKLKGHELSKQVEWLLNDLRTHGKRLTERLGQSRRFLMTIALAAICLLVLLLLSACSPKVVKPTLPVQADPRPLPEFKGKTYRDALMHIPELREAFLSCEADKEAIRKALSDE